MTAGLPRAAASLIATAEIHGWICQKVADAPHVLTLRILRPGGSNGPSYWLTWTADPDTGRLQLTDTQSYGDDGWKIRPTIKATMAAIISDPVEARSP